MGTVTESPCSMKVILSISTLVAAAIAQVPLGFAPHAAHHVVAPVVHAAPALHHAVHAAPAVHAVHAVHAAPAVHAVHAVHDVIPHDYTYGYDVNELDAYGNPNIHSKTETREGGVVKGQYRVNLPDCRTQIAVPVAAVGHHSAHHADALGHHAVHGVQVAPVAHHAVHAAPLAHHALGPLVHQG